MKVQEVKIVVEFFAHCGNPEDFFEGAIFLNIDPAKQVWYEEAKKVLAQKGYIDDFSFRYEEEDDYECGRYYFLTPDEWGKPRIQLEPFWIRGDVLTNE